VLLKVGAGESIPQFLNFLVSHGLSGFEWAGGLPGTVGGAIRGNAGAFGGETKDAVAEVVSLDISGRTPKLIKRNNKQCRFGYRNSIFKMRDLNLRTSDVQSIGPKEIVLEVVFQLKRGDKQAIKEAIEEKIRYREERQPLDYPNIGSIFKNVDLHRVPKKLRASLAHVIKKDPFPVVPTAYLISESGLKGIVCGGAMVSPKHPNFIINALGAQADDVKKLISLVKSEVYGKFKIKLEEEIVRVIANIAN
jgi:UDP-N-acetylmuramate dehydrogenase